MSGAPPIRPHVIDPKPPRRFAGDKRGPGCLNCGLDASICRQRPACAGEVVVGRIDAKVRHRREKRRKAARTAELAALTPRPSKPPAPTAANPRRRAGGPRPARRSGS